MIKENSVQVSYRRITANKDMLLMLFPAPIVESLEGTNTFVYGAIEAQKGSLVGACILSISDKISKAAILHYCAVSSKYMRAGIGSGLLTTASKSLRGIGVQYLIYREISDRPEPLLNSYRFATHNSFVPGAVKEKILYYKSKNLVNNTDIGRMKNNIRNVVQIEDPRDIRIMEFNKNANGFFTLKRKDYSPKMSGFYVEGGNIMGACKVLLDGKKVIINDIFLAPTVKDLEAYQMLLVNSVVNALQDVSIEEVCVQAVGDERIIEVKKIMGNPEKELPALELIRYLK